MINQISCNAHSFVSETCYYKQEYRPNYWKDSYRVGYFKARYIDNNNLTKDEIIIILKNIHINECLGIYAYFMYNKNFNKTFDLIIELNPFEENLIFNAFKLYYTIFSNILCMKILKYPNQRTKFIDYLINMDIVLEYENIQRQYIIKMINSLSINL